MKVVYRAEYTLATWGRRHIRKTRHQIVDVKELLPDIVEAARKRKAKDI